MLYDNYYFQSNKKIPLKIEYFTGDYNFLNNNYICDIYYKNKMYKSVTIAYISSKCNDKFL